MPFINSFFIFISIICFTTTYSEPLLINQICKQTSFPDKCKETFKDCSQCHSATNLHHLTNAVLNLNKENINKFIRILSYKIDDKDLPPKQRQIFKLCKIEYNYVFDKLNLVNDVLCERRVQSAMKELQRTAKLNLHAIHFCNKFFYKKNHRWNEMNIILVVGNEVLYVIAGVREKQENVD